MSGMLMSDQRSNSCCSLSDGKHNHKSTSNKKAISNNSIRNALGHETSERPQYDEATSYRRREPRLYIYNC